MNRRNFVLSSGGAALLLAGGGAALSLEGCSSSWITTAINDLPTILQVATTVGDMLSAVYPQIGVIVQAVSAGITLIQTLIKDYEAQPSIGIVQKIQAALLDLQQNLGSILTTIHIVNPALRLAVAGAVGIAVSALTEILSLLPPSTSAAALATQNKFAIKPRNAATIKQQVNGFLITTGYTKFLLT